MTNDLLRFGLLTMFAAFIAATWYPLHVSNLDVGDAAPHFSVTADNGEQVAVRDFNRNPVLLSFWASWCEPCMEEIPSLNALTRLLAPEGLVVLGISQDRNPAAYTDFLRNRHVDFLTSRQPDQSIQHKYGTIQIPETYLIDRHGSIRAKFISSQDWTSPAVVALIRPLL